HAADVVREPALRPEHPGGKLAEPAAVIGSRGEIGQHVVVRLGQSRIASQVAVHRRVEQEEHAAVSQPGPHLRVGQPPRHAAQPSGLLDMSSRLMKLYGGLVLFGVSMALMLRARLGLDSWDVLHQGISQRTGLAFGWVVIAVGALVLLLWVPLRQRPGLGTVSNVIVVGLAVDVALDVLPAPAPMG